MSIKTNKVKNLEDLHRQIALLNAKLEKAEKENDDENEEVVEDGDESEEQEESEDDESSELDEDENEEVDEEDEADENEEQEESEFEDEETETDDDDENPESEENENNEETSELSEKLDKLISDFEQYRRKSISLLEAIMSASRISIGLKESETPRVVKEKKVLATLNTASGKLKKEVAALSLRMDEDGVLHPTQISKVISKGDAVEEQIEIQGKIPNGDWIIVERKEKYYLVSTENFDSAKDVTPYENEEKETNEKKKGIVVNKKGVAHNVGGYELEDKPDYFKLTKESLNKPKKVFHAKWTKQGCDYPIKGEPIPEGTWVIVVDEEGTPFIVKAENVEPKISTKKTEKAEKKISKKKVPTKKAVKKVVKKVAKKNKKNKK